MCIIQSVTERPNEWKIKIWYKLKRNKTLYGSRFIHDWKFIKIIFWKKLLQFKNIDLKKNNCL